jgi:glutamate-5-semialdehyde dehydrogenase
MPLYDRLRLDGPKLRDLAAGARQLAAEADPVSRELERRELDDGLVLSRIAVPIGVLAIVFESRPDVIPQLMMLALRSGNALVLKGGAEARHSNRALIALADRLVADVGLPAGWAQLVETREDFRALLAYPEWIDLVIPRGSAELVRAIQQSTRIPVLGHAEGICHLYVNSGADCEEAIRIAIDAKIQYPAACNAVEKILVDRAIGASWIPQFVPRARAAGIEVRGCPETLELAPDAHPATTVDWMTEFGAPIVAVKVVGGLDEAVEHIHRFGSRHTDGILTRDRAVAERFLAAVDSASVIWNASTRFADGYRYGLGAEVGVSTAKLHARGPVGLSGLMIYKYVLRGSGQIVADYVGPGARPFRHRASGAH